MDSKQQCRHILLMTCLLGMVSAGLDQPSLQYVYEGQPNYFDDLSDSLVKNFVNGSSFREMVANAGQQDVSEQCKRDMLIIQKAEENSDNHTWVIQVDNSQGNFPVSGALLGKGEATGSYLLCLDVQPTFWPVYSTDPITGARTLVGRHDFNMHYCKRRYYTPPNYIGLSEGRCVPESCNRDDMVNMMQDSPVPGTYKYAYCGAKPPLKDNVGAIVALVIVGIFVTLVLIGTLLEAFYISYKKKEKAKAASNSKVELGLVNGACEITGVNVKTDESKLPGPTLTTGASTENHEPLPTDKGDKNQNGPGQRETFNEKPEQDSAKLVEKQRKEPGPSVLAKALFSFSLCTNLPSVLQTQSRGYDCMNGLRFMAMSWIVLGHAWLLDLETLTDPMNYFAANRFGMEDLKRRFGHMIINQFSVAVDVFFFLGGSLVTISFLKTIQRLKKEQTGILNVVKELALYVFHRYWRLTPLYAAILMIWANLWVYMGSGPLWPETNGAAQNCHTNWYLNLLYVNNFFGGSKLCMGWSWYLANDFQFYLIVPVFAAALSLRPTLGSVLLALAWVGTLVCRVALTMYGRVGFMEMYIKPWARFGPYAIGIAMGYIMHTTKCKVKMNKFTVLLGWLVALALGMLIIFGPYNRNQDWNNDMKIAFHVTQRDAFTLAVAWVVFACCTGYGGLVNRFLSWSLWIPLSRLCYASFLMHPMISFVALARRQQTFYVQDITIIYHYFGNLMLSLIVSLGMTLVFEVPFLALEKVILPARKK